MAEQGLVLTFKKKNLLEFSDLESIGLIRICSKIGRECILSSKERYGVSLSCILAAQKNRSGRALDDNQPLDILESLQSWASMRSPSVRGLSSIAVIM